MVPVSPKIGPVWIGPERLLVPIQPDARITSDRITINNNVDIALPIRTGYPNIDHFSVSGEASLSTDDHHPLYQ